MSDQTPQEKKEKFTLAEIKHTDVQLLVTAIFKAIEHYKPAIRLGLSIVAVISQELKDYAQKFEPIILRLASVDWKAAHKRLEDLPTKSKAAMELAASKGWFFGWDESLQTLMEMVDKLEVIDPSEIDQVMAQYYRRNLTFFRDRLLSRHPQRAPVIGAAITAHLTDTMEGYFLSIPVFIAQADGLLTELTEVNSATMKVRGGKTNELQSTVALRKRFANDQYSLDLIHPLLVLHELDIMKSSTARMESEKTSGEAFTALNRHQILHGESWDYGTELNSLKAISFLTFVGLHLPLVLERVQEKTDVAE